MKMLSKEDFINRCIEYHKDKYDYSLVEYKGMNNKISIICKEHGIFEQIARNHINGCNCPKCVNNNIKLTNIDFINRSKNIHGDRYDYSLVDYKNGNQDKVKIICKKHGIFIQRASSHLLGYGCSKCAGNFSSVDNFKEKSKTIHEDKYDYSLVKYVNNKKKIFIICKKHNFIFWQRPDNHLSGQGCPKCGNEITRKKTSDNLKKFVDKVMKIHGDKYDYSKSIYQNSKTKIQIFCGKCERYFWQTPNKHMKCGCPFCKNSKGENIIDNFLKERNIEYVRQKLFDSCRDKYPLSFDFYIPSLNVCIEYDGIQHFKSIEYWGGVENLKYIQNHDKIKTDYCVLNNIKLLRIRYNQNVVETLKKYFYI